LRIDLPVGSYVPEFQPAPAALPGPITDPPVPTRPWHRRHAWLLAAGTATVLAALAFGWSRTHARPSELDRFWAPVVAPGGSVLICVGDAGVPARADENNAPNGSHGGRITWPDTLTMARMTGFLQARGMTAQFCREEQATFSDFQLMPAVLIGGLNDEWALRLMENMRFQFRRDGPIFWIADRDHPQSRNWKIEVANPAEGGHLPLQRDYAVVSRVYNSRTGKITITVAGLWGSGTIAGGEFLTEPVYLREAAKKLPSDWPNRNVQFVLGAEVIEGNPGPPRVLATAVW